MAGTETPHHHGDHRHLVWKADDSSPQAKVNAIIVPTARPVAYLKDAAAAALSLDCPLITLHSQKWTSVHEAFQYLGQSIDLIAIDMPEAGELRLPPLETTRLLAGTIFERRTDVSTKRNLALVLCHALGWKRVVFLDDDIRVPNPADLRKAAGLLDTHTAVGLRIGGFPDNSMVCHAFRKPGGRQATFVGGGALAVEVKRNCSFFPNVYNEDWFYMLNAEKRLQSVATVGEVLQYPYDPTCQTGPGWRSSATCSPRAPSGCSTKGRQSRTAILRTGVTFWKSDAGSSSRCARWSGHRLPSSPASSGEWPWRHRRTRPPSSHHPAAVRGLPASLGRRREPVAASHSRRPVPAAQAQGSCAQVTGA